MRTGCDILQIVDVKKTSRPSTIKVGLLEETGALLGTSASMMRKLPGPCNALPCAGVRSQKGVTQKGVLVRISELAEAKQRG